MIYIKATVLNTIYNFVVEKFLIWSRLESQICVVSSNILKFKN
jgi:hypothetical protein